MSIYRTIVVGTDGSPTARTAVGHAAELARVTGAVLHVACVRRPEPVVVGAPELATAGFDAAGPHDAAASVALEDAAAEAAARGVRVQTHTPMGSTPRCLTDLAREVGADLLVVGNRGMRGFRRLIGSAPNSVTHSAPCDVLVVQTSWKEIQS